VKFESKENWDLVPVEASEGYSRHEADSKEVNHQMKFLAVLFSLGVSVTGVAPLSAAEPSPENRRAAISMVFGSDKPLTRIEYDLFWSKLSSFTIAEKKEFISLMRAKQSDLMDFNLYTWECADQAWMKRQSVKCPKASEVWGRFSKRLHETHGVSSDAVRALPMLENHKRIISAASQRHSYRSVSGEVFDLSDRKVILETIFSFKARAERLNKVLSENFVE